ncbi:hypothetical protein B0H19DRAFT_1082677 [Mycena capillaripes]|nr:hypothetical protein B0H19DRAFT_1082677 [Mycena capillaripes]
MPPQEHTQILKSTKLNHPSKDAGARGKFDGLHEATLAPEVPISRNVGRDGGAPEFQLDAFPRDHSWPIGANWRSFFVFVPFLLIRIPVARYFARKSIRDVLAWMGKQTQAVERGYITQGPYEDTAAKGEIKLADMTSPSNDVAIGRRSNGNGKGNEPRRRVTGDFPQLIFAPP